MAVNKSSIITHRGLEPSKANFYSESSFEAFQDHLARGFSIEFDPQPLSDGSVAVIHDPTLKRITNGKDTREIRSLTWDTLSEVTLERGRIPKFKEVLELIAKSNTNCNALHIKGGFQDTRSVDLIVGELTDTPEVWNKILLFDIKPEIAKEIKKKCSGLQLAPSLSHPYDIERYNTCVKETLFTVEQAIELSHKNGGPFCWVWLDEWDLADTQGGKKKFYTDEVFAKCRNAGLKIGLVTPELHGTSPGLLGGEAHEDAKPLEVLLPRIKEILQLKPDAICTDYPEEAFKMLA